MKMRQRIPPNVDKRMDVFHDYIGRVPHSRLTFDISPNNINEPIIDSLYVKNLHYKAVLSPVQYVIALQYVIPLGRRKRHDTSEEVALTRFFMIEGFHITSHPLKTCSISKNILRQCKFPSTAFFDSELLGKFSR